MQEGYKYHGVSNIEVIKFNVNNMIMIGVPFINNDGTVEMAGFMNGEYLGIAPDDEK